MGSCRRLSLDHDASGVGQRPTLGCIATFLAAPPAPRHTSSLGSGQSKELLFLFLVLPFLVAGVVIAFVAWRSSGGPRPVLTSEILAGGLPAQAEILSVK